VASGRILVIDDEAAIVELVSAYLRRESYDVFTASDGVSGLKMAQAVKPDLVVLDVMLPGLGGLELLSQLRRDSDVYVIMLTARSEELDKVVALSVGADDYLTKPFSPRELVARVQAALRRLKGAAGPMESKAVATRHLRLDLGGRQAWIRQEAGGERPLELTTVEFDLLKALVEHRGLVLSREQLLQLVWGYDYYGDDRVVDVHIAHIRQKLGDGDLIATVRGVGYRFQDEPL
jgi:two-component system, OmpR family, alkaline phosphatase synthesis response regulator PhoP